MTSRLEGCRLFRADVAAAAAAAADAAAAAEGASLVGRELVENVVCDGDLRVDFGMLSVF